MTSIVLTPQQHALLDLWRQRWPNASVGRVCSHVIAFDGPELRTARALAGRGLLRTANASAAVVDSRRFRITPTGWMHCRLGVEVETIVATCRKCGCTDEWGCDGGCFWIARDLCSECA